MSSATLTRRGLIAGLVTVLGALAARAAEAFTLRDRLRFRAASELLDEYGVSVRGLEARSHDVLLLDVVPRPEIQYDQIVRKRTRSGEIIPCVRTSVFGGVEEFSVFDAETGAVAPSYKTTRQGDVVTSEHFHPLVSGLDPCLRTTVTHTEATLELFDLTDGRDAGYIIPCIRVVSAMSEDGSLGAVEVTVDPDEQLTVRVGDRVYRLVNGELVPDTRS